MEYKGDSTALELIQKHDTIVITAWRYTDDCGEDGNILSKAQKRNENKKLERDIKNYDYDYGIGHFVEGGVDVIEENFIVYDTKNTGKLIQLGKKLGEKYIQYSVMLIENGSAVIYGTNHCPDADPAYGKTMTLGKVKSGKGDPAWTTVIKSKEEFHA